MAKQLVTVCDLANTSLNGCAGAVTSLRIWTDGDRTARSIDLCERHGSPVSTLLEHSREVELPARPRMTMQVTKLQTTEATAHLKRKD